MNFSKLRHRLIFLQPTDLIKNESGETVPRYKPFHPGRSFPLRVEDTAVYLTYGNDGNAGFVYEDGRTYAHKLALQEYSVAAFVTPMSGREYEESQKLRVETTYKIFTRFFPHITPELRLYYDGKEFEIVSVLDLNERHEELQIVACEKGKTTAQTFSESED